MRMTPSDTPAPMPALAPEDNPPPPESLVLVLVDVAMPAVPVSAAPPVSRAVLLPPAAQ